MKTQLHPPLVAILAPLITAMICRKSTLPVLSGVRVTTGPGYMRLRATDLDREIDIAFGPEPDEPDFDRWVEWQPIKDAVKRDWIQIEVTPDDCMVTSFHKGVTYEVSAGSWANDSIPEQFIKDEDSGWHPVKNDFLRNIVDLEGVCSDDQTRYVLNGVFCDCENQVMVGTDGRFMNIIQTDLPKIPFALNPNNQWYRPESGFIIPRHRIFGTDLLKGRPGEIRIGSSHRYCTKEEADAAIERGSKDGPHYVEPYQRFIDIFEFKLMVGPVSVLLRTKLIEGNYPNYRQVIPTKGCIVMDINAAAVYDQIKVLKAHKLDSIHLEIEPNKLTIARTDKGVTLAKFTVPAKVKATMKIAVAYRGLEYALKQGFSNVFLTDEESPLLFETAKAQLIVMPMRVMGAPKPEEAEVEEPEEAEVE